ncbi:MAG TPA: response regulator [Stenotrophomonas sp.]|jgi:DNA-binding response OmpR family regulator
MSGLPSRAPVLLVAEDEMVLAMTLADFLEAEGFQVRTAARVADAIGIVSREAVDAALLDINLNNEKVYPVCELLRERRVPFIFTSAYDASCTAQDMGEHAHLQKPYSFDALRALLAKVLEGRS